MRLIDADEFIKSISQKRKGLTDHCRYCSVDCYECVADKIGEQETVDAKPVIHGRWHDIYLISNTSEYSQVQTCSCCSNTIVMNTSHVFNYCPACGAIMDLDGGI